MSQQESAWAIAEELMSQNMLDVPIYIAAPVIAKVLASRPPATTSQPENELRAALETVLSHLDSRWDGCVDNGTTPSKKHANRIGTIESELKTEFATVLASRAPTKENKEKP